MTYAIRTATAADQQATLALLPELSDFDVPEYRNPDHTWQGDAKLLKQFFNNQTPDTHALVYEDTTSEIQGISIYTMRSELLSGEPSAHLEVLVVNSSARRQGIGKLLVDATEKGAKALGATSLTLHVFANNTRARGLYQACEFKEELLRCYKPI